MSNDCQGQFHLVKKKLLTPSLNSFIKYENTENQLYLVDWKLIFKLCLPLHGIDSADEQEMA